jgi:hypothetical protein
MQNIVLYLKAVVLAAVILFSVAVSLIYIDWYLDRRFPILDPSYDECAQENIEENVAAHLKSATLLKKSRFIYFV